MAVLTRIFLVAFFLLILLLAGAFLVNNPELIRPRMPGLQLPELASGVYLVSAFVFGAVIGLSANFPVWISYRLRLRRASATVSGKNNEGNLDAERLDRQKGGADRQAEDLHPQERQV